MSDKSSPNHAGYGTNDSMRDPLGQLRDLQQKHERDWDKVQSNSSTIISSRVPDMPRPLLNYGERLYQKGIKQKEELIRQGREAKAKEEQ